MTDTPIAELKACPFCEEREFLAVMADWVARIDALREFERENPNNTTRRWDDLRHRVEAGETAARAAIARATEG